ncbi:MAG TPA: WecB/TagA/CpsF family glycosyltransferase [Steroidobacteraceae bacterium]|nr:WecB/TagA/CpsF family glycosyltransferase [Steroidobacteraceae bacterium]
MPITLELDDQDLEQFVHTAAQFGMERFGYAVTPNADHVIRFYDDPSFRDKYADAAFVLSDSHFLSHVLAVTRGIHVPVCAGSDLTQRLFAQVIRPDDRVVLIGASSEQAGLLREKFGLADLKHLNPPMGFIRDPAAVRNVLEFIEQHSPFRFCLLAVGSPQQETVAQLLKRRDNARGLALCIGASVDFLTGKERRAPGLMQRIGLEWAFRLLQSPRRLGARYLVRGPRVFGILRRIEIRLRPG